jgi:hypothetical protein
MAATSKACDPSAAGTAFPLEENEKDDIGDDLGGSENIN